MTDEERYAYWMTADKNEVVSTLMEESGKVLVLSEENRSLTNLANDVENERDELQNQLDAIQAGISVSALMPASSYGLSERQVEIIQTIVNMSPAGQGEMAESLGIARSTFSAHLASIGDTWNIRSSQLAVAIVLEALRRGVVSMS